MPPLTTATTVPVSPAMPASRARNRAAAGASAPDGSATSRASSAISRTRGSDLRLGHRHDVVHEPRQVREVAPADRLRAHAVRDRLPVRAASQLTIRPSRSDACASAATSGSTPMIRAPRYERANRHGYPARQPATADRHEHGGEIRHVLGDLQPERALAGDDPIVVERMDEHQPALRDQLARDRVALADRRARGHDLRAVRDDAAALDLGRVAGHDDHGADAQQTCGPRDALAVVAGRVGDDSSGALLGRKRGDRVVRTSDLERADGLQRFRLEQDPGPALARRPERDERRANRHAGENRCGPPDVVDA